MTPDWTFSRRALFASALLLPLGGALAAERVRVIDGDTIRLGSEKMRLADADAPELHHPRCAKELHLARQAKAALERLVTDGQLRVESRNFDDRGEVEAVVLVDGVSVGAQLVALGLARPRHGPEAGQAWCVGLR